jgi:hypothetical protein
MIDVWAAMAQAGWRYEPDDRTFAKDGMVVTFEQAERALFDAAHGIDRSVAANDDEMP